MTGKINNILLIDDDNIFNFLNKKIIQKSLITLSIKSYVNPAKALEALRDISATPDIFPEIIFLDINMPIMDGWEFLDEFEKLPEKALVKCGVYILTSSIDPSDIEKSREYRCVKDFISKPLTKEILESVSGRQSSLY